MHKRIEMTVFKYFMARLTTLLFRVTWQSCHCQSHCCSKWSQSSLSRCVHTAWLDCQSSARCSWPCCMGQYYAKKRKRKKRKNEKFKYSYSFFSAIFDYHSILRRNIQPCLVIRQRRGQEAEDVAEHQRVQLSRPGAEEEERRKGGYRKGDEARQMRRERQRKTLFCVLSGSMSAYRC